MRSLAILLTGALLLPAAAVAQTAPADTRQDTPTTSPNTAQPDRNKPKRTRDRHHPAPDASTPHDPAAHANQPGTSADSMNRPQTTPTHGTDPDEAEGPR